MPILTLSGSSSASSTNGKLLDFLPTLFPEKKFTAFQDIRQFPLFRDGEESEIPHIITEFKSCIQSSNGIIISTPEYIQNIPAVLKNALEWITSSGELSGKKVLAITYTPSEPRGEKAMQSLCHSLQALSANIVGSLSIYHSDIDPAHKVPQIRYPEIATLLKEGIAMLE